MQSHGWWFLAYFIRPFVRCLWIFYGWLIVAFKLSNKLKNLVREHWSTKQYITSNRLLFCGQGQSNMLWLFHFCFGVFQIKDVYLVYDFLRKFYYLLYVIQTFHYYWLMCNFVTMFILSCNLQLYFDSHYNSLLDIALKWTAICKSAAHQSFLLVNRSRACFYLGGGDFFSRCLCCFTILTLKFYVKVNEKLVILLKTIMWSLVIWKISLCAFHDGKIPLTYLLLISDPIGRKMLKVIIAEK